MKRADGWRGFDFATSINVSNPYIGGRAGSHPEYDYCFKTYTTPAANATLLAVLNGRGVSMMGFQLPPGAGANKVLTSDASGVGTWQPITLAGISGGALVTDGNAVALNDRPLRLRGLGDANHTLGFFSTFNGATIDGPVLMGYNGGALATNQNGALSTALTWNTAGHVGIGTSSPQNPLHIAAMGGSSGSLANGVHLGRDAGGNARIELVGGTSYIDFSNDNSSDYDARLILENNDSLVLHGAVFSHASDARLKHNIVTLDNALDRILNLRGVSYEWNQDSGFGADAGRQIGFIAQEVEKVLPELVHTGKNGYKSVAYQNVVPVLVEAVKTQQKHIETLKAQKDTEVKALKAENAELRARLDALTEAVQQLQNDRK